MLLILCIYCYFIKCLNKQTSKVRFESSLFKLENYLDLNKPKTSLTQENFNSASSLKVKFFFSSSLEGVRFAKLTSLQKFDTKQLKQYYFNPYVSKLYCFSNFLFDYNIESSSKLDSLQLS